MLEVGRVDQYLGGGAVAVVRVVKLLLEYLEGGAAGPRAAAALIRALQAELWVRGVGIQSCWFFCVFLICVRMTRAGGVGKLQLVCDGVARQGIGAAPVPAPRTASMQPAATCPRAARRHLPSRSLPCHLPSSEQEAASCHLPSSEQKAASCHLSSSEQKAAGCHLPSSDSRNP